MHEHAITLAYGKFFGDPRNQVFDQLEHMAILICAIGSKILRLHTEKLGF